MFLFLNQFLKYVVLVMLNNFNYKEFSAKVLKYANVSTRSTESPFVFTVGVFLHKDVSISAILQSEVPGSLIWALT
jgi:hypothetical protein